MEHHLNIEKRRQKLLSLIKGMHKKNTLAPGNTAVA
jgi:hypothetical protein